MKHKRLLEVLLFLFVMILTFYAVFSANDMPAALNALKRLNPAYLFAAMAAVLFFVSAEGFMIWYLLRSLGGKTGLLRCVSYSFIGFFFSGITPSATGGQPMQLYCMKKDRTPLADGALVLMIVAVLYKLVLVILGGLLLLFWKEGLRLHLGGYMGLFYLGISLNVVLVGLLLLVMFHGEFMEKLLLKGEAFLTRIHILAADPIREQADTAEKTATEALASGKISAQSVRTQATAAPSDTAAAGPSANLSRRGKIHRMIAGYQDTLFFFTKHKGKILFVTGCTFLQRIGLFFMTWLIYKGLRLSGSDLFTVMALQASVYIAVDMLPLPGSQGISELMYQAVFPLVFPAGYLAASMCVTRGVGFYLPLALSGLVTLFRFLPAGRGHRPAPTRTVFPVHSR